MGTGVDRIIQLRGGDAPAKNQTGVQKIIELLGGDPPAKNQTGVDKIVEILENGGGGGNPNRVETITGTLADPFGDLDFLSFYNAILNDGANARIDIDASALGYPTLHAYSTRAWDSGNGKWIQFAAAAIYGDSNDMALDCTIGIAKGTPDGSLSAWVGGTVITVEEQYTSLLPTTLTIIWHPLPN